MRYTIYILWLVILTQGCSPETPKLYTYGNNPTVLLTKQTNYNAGDNITLSFKNNQNTASVLV
ncbi:MAG: hypothetical protein KJP26_06900, partial [Maribacter sp.]|nr:hypothetical protein [Maribacter sp.]